MRYWIKDIRLSNKGKSEIQQTLRDMPGISEIRKQFSDLKPLKGLRITGCVWVTYETANFILLLRDLGADIKWCSDNKYASLDDACAYLVSEGVSIFAKRGMTDEEYFGCFEQVWQFEDSSGNIVGPDYIIDDGCDITRYLHEHHPNIMTRVKGVTEQTTCGVTALMKLFKEGKLLSPVINVNDSITKSKFDNIYGSRESLIEGIQNAVNIQIAGKKCIIYGYGEVGKGCAQTMKALGAHIGICEIDPVMAIQAHMQGYEVYDRVNASKVGEIFITATGCIKTVDEEDLNRMKEGVFLMNMGHGNMEVNTEYLNSGVFSVEEVNPLLQKYRDNSGREIFLLCGGYLVNATGGSGHPPRVMSITFTNHFVALLRMIQNPEQYSEKRIYKLSRKQEEFVANLNFPDIKQKLIKLTEEQADYLGVSIDGPFKRDDYKY
jgi:adenosylhomocysteinase